MKILSISSKKSFYIFLFIPMLLIAWSCTGNDKSSTTTTTENNQMNTDTAINAPKTDNMNNNMSNAMDTTADKQADAAFLIKAAEINLEEIKLGQLAQQKGTMSHVKELGKMMVDEHTKAMKDLMALAKTKMVTLPTEPGAPAMEAYTSMKAKPGKEFDKEYSDMMVMGHKDAIELFEKNSTDGKDADVKAWASKMLPALRTHLDHSMMCQKECNKM